MGIVQKLNIIFNSARNRFMSGDNRTRIVKKNIALSSVLKILEFLTDLAIVPVSIGLLGNQEYGIWLTIAIFFNWFTFIDLGLGHGLRNKLAIALSENNLELSKKFISTSYVVISIIVLTLVIIFTLIIPFLKWNYLLNVETATTYNISLIVLIAFNSFALRLGLRTILSVFLAVHKSALKDLVLFLTKFSNLVLLFFLFDISGDRFAEYALVVTIAPVIVLLLVSIIAFSKMKTIKHIRPSLKFFDKKCIRELFSLGGKFFVIQITTTILFMTDNLIISHLFGPSFVTPYQVVHKYYNIALYGFMVIMQPMWSAFTEAYAKNEMEWIRRIMRKIIKLWKFLVIGTLIMILLSEYLISLWTSNQIEFTMLLSVFMGAFVILHSYNMIFTYFINGLGKISLQLILSIVNAIINIPLSIIFAKYLHMGISGVILATNICLLIYILFKRIQYNKLITNTAYGIWNK